MAGTVPQSFVHHGPKLRIRMIAIGDWPEMAKKRDPHGKTPLPRKRKFFFRVENFWGSPGYIEDMPF